MKKKEKPEPTTAVGKLKYFNEELKVFLHPRVTEALEKLIWDVRSEFAQEAKDKVFSQEMQELQPFLERFREDMQRYGEADRRCLWHMRPVIKKIIELYGSI